MFDGSLYARSLHPSPAISVRSYQSGARSNLDLRLLLPVYSALHATRIPAAARTNLLEPTIDGYRRQIVSPLYSDAGIPFYDSVPWNLDGKLNPRVALASGGQHDRSDPPHMICDRSKKRSA